ncbi:hypothetical protein [Halomonas caseinilytica]|uniref:hypothetical protein n=1 Tax=Halomonas caseinilytica TaxID=438744 RepID=UPI0007E573CA|nr:hypothetical protein [Halomonas caseinilytica]SEM47130.1 hypothetical protein SAMN04487952_10486 [Halomonas caseinilytica]
MTQHIAVLTGDIIDSRRIADSRRLHGVLDETLEHLASHHDGRYERFRGDGFQLAMPNAATALDVAVALRAALVMHGETQRWDARVAVAVGADTWQPDAPLAAADGPVFVASGQGLDAMGDEAHLTLALVDAPEDPGLALLIRYVDELIDGWSRHAAEITHLRLWHDASQQALADHLGIRQPSVHKRLRTARWALLADTLAFFRSRLAMEGPSS